MRVFISHSFKDKKLANRLKQILENNTGIEEAYLAEKSKNFKVVISKKIIDKIKKSDYVVLIATKNSQCSASTNQEIGFAQGISHIQIIPLAFRNKKIGVFLDDKDTINFTEKNFEKKCNEVLDHIIKMGPTQKPYSDEEGVIVQKSAHFRYELEQELIQFMDGILVYYQIEPNGKQIFFDEAGRGEAHRIIKNFINDQEKMCEKINTLELRNLVKIYNDYVLLKQGIEDAIRFPHTILFEDEEDAFLKLKERMVQVSGFSIDIIKYLQETLEVSNVDYDMTFRDIIDNHVELVSLPRYLRSYVYDMMILTRAVIDLDQILIKIRKKFGDMAFKDTYDKDSV